MSKLKEVGGLTCEKKQVTELNHMLYCKAKKILEDETFTAHMGWYSVGHFIDWLEQEFHIIPKMKNDKLVVREDK